MVGKRGRILSWIFFVFCLTKPKTNTTWDGRRRFRSFGRTFNRYTHAPYRFGGAPEVVLSPPRPLPSPLKRRTLVAPCARPGSALRAPCAPHYRTCRRTRARASYASISWILGASVAASSAPWSPSSRPLAALPGRQGHILSLILSRTFFGATLSMIA